MIGKLVLVGFVVALAVGVEADDYEITEEEREQINEMLAFSCVLISNPVVLDVVIPCSAVFDTHPVMKAFKSCIPANKTVKQVIKSFCDDADKFIAIGLCMKEQVENSIPVPQSTENKMEADFQKCVKSSF